MKPTPGPWRVAEGPSISDLGDRYRLIIVAGEKDSRWGIGYVEWFKDSNDEATQRANARLIKSAPTLLDAAKQALALLPPDMVKDSQSHQTAQILAAAIAEAVDPSEQKQVVESL